MELMRFEVTSERGPYPVVIGSGASSSVPTLLAEQGIDRQRVVVTAPPIWRLQGTRLQDVLGPKERPALIPDGERAKTLATVARVYEACARRALDRSGALLAFGGGVVGDVTGFAAATYLRGIRLVQIPTTLLAQVDSAIGGKVGVNLASGKNLVGSFHSPSLVVCDPDVLATLGRREFRAGLYEVVKYGVIRSPDLFAHVATRLQAIFAREAAALTSIVRECCRIKADIVMADERETGPRRILNFGHTVGHALESITEYRRFRHGEAIAYGMLAAARLSVMRGTMAEADAVRLATLVRDMGPLPPIADLRAADALDVISRDKKVVAGRLHFVLARGIGDTEIVTDVQTKELTQAMKHVGLRA